MVTLQIPVFDCGSAACKGRIPVCIHYRGETIESDEAGESVLRMLKKNLAGYPIGLAFSLHIGEAVVVDALTKLAEADLVEVMVSDSLASEQNIDPIDASIGDEIYRLTAKGAEASVP